MDINNNLLTSVSLSLFACKSCLDSLFQLVKLILQLDSFEQELNQIFFLLEANSFKDYFNLNKEKRTTAKISSKISTNQLICIDFVLYTATELLKLDSVDVKYTDILWRNLIEAYYFSLTLQSNIDHSLACDFETPVVNKESFATNRTLSQLRENTMFKSVYSNLSEIAHDNLPKSKSNDQISSAPDLSQAWVMQID